MERRLPGGGWAIPLLLNPPVTFGSGNILNFSTKSISNDNSFLLP